MRIKVNNNQYTVPVLKFPSLLYLTKTYALKCFGNVKIIKTLLGFELVTYSFFANALTHCTTPSGTYIFLESKNMNLHLIVYVYFNMLQYEGVPYHLKVLCSTNNLSRLLFLT